MPSNQPRQFDASKATRDQKIEIPRYAAEVRKFEIDKFWQRSAFFWTFIGAAFVAYVAIYSQKNEFLPLIVACFGVLSSLAWTLQNSGSKYWQDSWEQKVASVETDVLGAPLFSNIEPLQRKGIWGAAPFSVSSLAIAISDLTSVVWIALLIEAVPLRAGAAVDLASAVIIGVAAIYAGLMFCCGRSEWARFKRGRS